MKVYNEERLRWFDFWCEAEDNAAMLTPEELDRIENELKEHYPNGIDKMDLNDLFRFDFEWICSLIGLTYNPKTDEIIRK